MVKRIFDICFSIFLIVCLLPILLLISIVIKLTSKGPILFFSHRVGQNNILFLMPKFRSMNIEAPLLSKDKIKNPHKYITYIGKYLRKFSLDELPQLFSILVGKMSFVGPRPALKTQTFVIKFRTRNNIHLLRPGLTGPAQLYGRDDLHDLQKLKLDKYYLENKSFCYDLKLIFLTALHFLFGKGVKH